MISPFVEAKGVSLEFVLRKPSVFDMVKGTSKHELNSCFRAVDNLSFRMNVGDRIGIIGKNGAGKSTLLKLLSGVLAPTEGILKLQGKVFPLLDLSSDIILQASCLQNIRLRGYQLGFSGVGLEQYIKLVRSTADIEAFLYSPVSTLSTGMKTRFLVSLLGDIKPEILIMDEWIGTTDKSFTNKNFSRMGALVDSSDIFILATHNRALLKEHCNKVMLIDKGRLVFFGDVQDGYERFNKIISI